jgi:hypothetical protein
MRLTLNSGVSVYLSRVSQLLIYSALLIFETEAHCYTSSISVPALSNPKHIELTLNIQKEIVSLEQSINQLVTEIEIKPPKAPIFLAVLCMASYDLSEMQNVPENKTLYSAYILPSTSYVLLAHSTGS